ncbi:MAG: hypothetical protein CMM53_07920 [Rhodospirillaceae bacterium]|nr:hypothetical protein [Rhodospirillaceae bacterium]|tara:strand:+ start:1592 stop:2476 length:885 start_codon:yes stop_codon:yes gene_type:complete
MRKLISLVLKTFNRRANSEKSISSVTSRKKPAPKWARPATNSAIIIVSILLLICGPLWTWKSGVLSEGIDTLENNLIQQTASLGLRVNKVILRGRYKTPRYKVIDAIGLKKGDPIMGVKLEVIRRNLVKIPWIQNATVQRNWPSTIYIRISERKPIALWDSKRQKYLIDAQGKTFISERIESFRYLLVVAGHGAPSAALKLLNIIGKNPSLAAKITRATFVGKRRWNLKLKSGIKIRLPEKNPHKAWKRLIELNSKKRILARDIRLIDMRLPKSIIIKPGFIGRQIIQTKGQKT